MVKKNFLFIIITLFSIAFLLSGCSQNNSTQQAKIVSDVPTGNSQNTPTTPKKQNVVDSTFNSNVVSNNDTVVEIGSLV